MEAGYKGRLNERLFALLIFILATTVAFRPYFFYYANCSRKICFETDYNSDGSINRIEDIVDNNIIDSDDYDESFNHWRNGLEGVTAMDTFPGYTPLWLWDI